MQVGRLKSRFYNNYLALRSVYCCTVISIHRRKLLVGRWARAPPPHTHFLDHGARLRFEPPPPPFAQLFSHCSLPRLQEKNSSVPANLKTPAAVWLKKKQTVQLLLPPIQCHKSAHSHDTHWTCSYSLASG